MDMKIWIHLSSQQNSRGDFLPIKIEYMELNLDQMASAPSLSISNPQTCKFASIAQDLGCFQDTPSQVRLIQQRLNEYLMDSSLIEAILECIDSGIQQESKILIERIEQIYNSAQVAKYG